MARAGGTNARRGRLASAWETISSLLWPVPVAITLAAVAAGLLLPALDRGVDRHLPSFARSILFGGGAAGGRAVLTSIATGLITTVSLVFSLTVVIFQLASSQYSPRLLRIFPRNPMIRTTLGVLVGAFVYALTVLRAARDSGVPRISITFGFVLTVVAAILLIVFLGHIVTELRIETMLKRVHTEHERVVDRMLGSDDGDRDEEDDASGDDHAGHRADDHADDQADDQAREHDDHVVAGRDRFVAADDSGFLVAVDEEHLLHVCKDHDVSLRVLRAVGESVTAGTPVVAVHPFGGSEASAGCPAGGAVDGADGDSFDKAVRAGLVIGYERTAAQDIGYGIQQLVDVYVKALSPGINDPSTALASLNHLSAALSRLARSDLRAREVPDGDGRARLRIPMDTFASLLDAALRPARTYGSDDPAVMVRVMEVLRSIGWVARDRPSRHQGLRQQITRTLAAAENSLDSPEELDDVRRAGRRAEAALRGDWA